MRSALVVAHPGHELRLFAWSGRARPDLCVIAKGARNRLDAGRADASRAIAAEIGTVPRDPFGAFHDVVLYEWIMAGDAAPFVRLAETLAEAFVARGVATVVTDGWQNYNPVHDLTHLMARTAAALAQARLGRLVDCLDYPVVLGKHAHAPPGPETLRIELSPDEAAAKRGLIDRYPDIAGDVEALIEAAGLAAMEVETLHRPAPIEQLFPSGAPPWYESYGRARVEAGVYREALGWAHMAPVAHALAERLRGALCAC